MSRGRVIKVGVTLTATTGLLLGVSLTAGADSPPPSWDDLRSLDCDGEVVEAAFTPGGVFTSFHVVGGADVIVPKRVEVVFPGETEPVTTLAVPGFARNQRDSVHCSYTDPAGLSIQLRGVRS